MKVQTLTRLYTTEQLCARADEHEAAGQALVGKGYAEDAAACGLTANAYALETGRDPRAVQRAIDRAEERHLIRPDDLIKLKGANTKGAGRPKKQQEFAEDDGPGSPDLAAELIDRLPVLSPRAVPAGLEKFMGAPTEQELQELYQIEQDLSQDDWLRPIGTAMLTVRYANALLDSEKFTSHNSIRRGIYDRLTRELDDALKVVQRIRKALDAFTIEEN